MLWINAALSKVIASVAQNINKNICLCIVNFMHFLTSQPLYNWIFDALKSTFTLLVYQMQPPSLIQAYGINRDNCLNNMCLHNVLSSCYKKLDKWTKEKACFETKINQNTLLIYSTGTFFLFL